MLLISSPGSTARLCGLDTDYVIRDYPNVRILPVEMPNPIGTAFMYDGALHVSIIDSSWRESVSIWRLDPIVTKIAEIAINEGATISDAKFKSKYDLHFALGSHPKIAICGSAVYVKSSWAHNHYRFDMDKVGADGLVQSDYTTSKDYVNAICTTEDTPSKHAVTTSSFNYRKVIVCNNIDATTYEMEYDHAFSIVYRPP